MFNLNIKTYFLQESRSNITEVIADDTDVAILLLYHWNAKLFDILLTSEISKKSWSVKACCGELAPALKTVLLLLHAFSGCDTTSSIFGYGKTKVLKLFKSIC